MLRRRLTQADKPTSNALGGLVRDEVERAESDYASLRARAQSILTVSGLLVTALAGLLAIAVGRDANLNLTPVTTAAAAITLLGFVCANVMVLLIFLPSTVEWPDPNGLANYVDEYWEARGWDRQVALVLVSYLKSLRAANAALAKKLAAAVTFQAMGVLGATLMVLSLLDSI